MFGEDGPTFWELARQALSSTRDGYDMLAAKFDHTPFRTPDAILDAVFTDVPEGLDAGVDLCCGTGAALPYLAERCRRVVGVDFSPGMLEVAWHRTEPLKREGADIEVVESDIFTFDEAEAYDVVTCFGAFGHVPTREAELVDRVFRLLRPGGRFVFASAEAPPPTSPAYLLSKAFNAAMHVRNAIVDPPFIMFYLTFMLPACARLLERRGFAVSRRPGGLEPPLSRLEVVTAVRTRN